MPPTRTSISQDSSEIGNDFGAPPSLEQLGLRPRLENGARRAAERSRDDELAVGGSLQVALFVTGVTSLADVRAAKADLLHAIYERIVVAGRFFVNARLTPAA